MYTVEERKIIEEGLKGHPALLARVLGVAEHTLLVIGIDFARDRDWTVLTRRPVPKFSKGQTVMDESGKTWTVSAIEWNHGAWFYKTNDLWCNESFLKPAPKFAVGEWVTHPTWGDIEIVSREWEVCAEMPHGAWIYKHSGIVRNWENSFTAQTPQRSPFLPHASGTVFLGRHGKVDLWYWENTLIAVHETYEIHCVANQPTNTDLAEARRRAVKRSLTK